MPILNWLNKDQAVRAAKNCSYRLLKAEHELAYGDENSENLLIQGDNLEALKALIPFYAGKVKCIYIDPPFNTGQALTHYDDNLEHSLWLEILYPRLELLRELMSEDGTIFIHIDDNEIGYMAVILDEIFGRKNKTHVVAFKQGSATGHKAINPGMVNTCNFIFCYCKNKLLWNPNSVFTERDRDKRYSQFIVNYDDHYSKWKTIPLLEAFAQSNDLLKKDLKSHFKDSLENQINEFVLSNSEKVIRGARPDYKAVGKGVQEAIDHSKSNPNIVYLHERENNKNIYLKNGERWIFYKDKLKNVDGELVAGEPLTTLWSDILSNNLHNEGNVKFPKSKKPEALIKRILEIATKDGDIILDSFLGSGTTAAVAHKMNRRYIGIEIGDHAVTHCQPRLKQVVDGEQGGISKAVNWQGGGGFRFCRLGAEVFDAYGGLNPEIKFADLAAHVWYLETGQPMNRIADTPFLGRHNDTAYYLLYNGILGDRTPQGGNVLTSSILKSLPQIDGPGAEQVVIYGESCRLGEQRLKQAGLIFKQIPYDVAAL